MTTTDAKTYPLPPAPAWAVEDYMEEDRRSYTRVVGRFVETQVDGDQQTVVQLTRRDEITSTTLTEGATMVWLLDSTVTPAQARVVAALLLQAADIAELG